MKSRFSRHLPSHCIRFAACPLLLCAGGCATLMNGGKGAMQSVFIDSDPHGAAVTVDGAAQGTTPSRVSLDRRHSHEVRIELPGYQPESRKLTSGANGWLLGNFAMIGMFPVGMGVDLLTGNWQSLSSTDFAVHLISKDQAR